MANMPTIPEVLAILDQLPKTWTRPAGPDRGLGFVTWRDLSFALFPQGDARWRRPQGAPHGLDRSPAYEFMDMLWRHPAFTTARVGGQQYFAVKP